MGSPVLETAQKTRPGTPVEGSEVTESRVDWIREAVELAIVWVKAGEPSRPVYVVICRDVGCRCEREDCELKPGKRLSVLDNAQCVFIVAVSCCLRGLLRST
jgi:hypothetical protein